MAAENSEQADAPLATLTEAAYAGAPAGEAVGFVNAGLLRCGVLLRPDVPMGQLVAAPAVVALGVRDALLALGAAPHRVGIGWPSDVVLDEGDATLARVASKAGYADGTFVVAAVNVELDLLPSALEDAPTEGLVQAVCASVVARADAWARDSHTDRAKAGPWATFLPEYFDCVPLLGRPVNVCYPNGRVYARGHFVGIDIWGRATVRTKNAGDIEFPPEKFIIRPQA